MYDWLAMVAILALASPLAAGTFYEEAPGRLPLCSAQSPHQLHVIPPLSAAPQAPSALPDLGMPGDRILTEEPDLGIINGLLTTNITYRDVLSLRGLWAPPFASSDFSCQVRLAGEKVPTARWRWQPAAVTRQGTLPGLAVESTTALGATQRLAMLAFTVRNRTRHAVQVPLQVVAGGTLEAVQQWEFGRPATSAGTTVKAGTGELALVNQAGMILVGTDLALAWEPWSAHWVGALALGAGEAQTHYLCLGIGEPAATRQAVAAARRDPAAALRQAEAGYQARVRQLFSRLPTLQADDKRLERYYHRSLVHLLTNQWQVPEFVLHPCFTTGSINGGCVCSYLWDYGEAWELLPLLDPAAVRAHIKQFLGIDLTSHFAFSPITGAAFGPWYPVNQEKIIRSIYYYVLFTGDAAFLKDTVAGKTILDWVIYHAMAGDDLSRPIALIDYGNGNHHLELRGQYRYDNYLPDLNGRRYDNCVAAYHLSVLGGQPAPYLLERAAALKRLLKDTMWSPEHRWFFHLAPDLTKQLRYTIQVFKLIGSDVLDREEEEGLLSHINEREFLSAYGMHSMSKLDEAYDQIDIDNGGGGSYVSFPPQIAERLYRAGHPDLAADILQRILWLGERLPYWGDSQVANAMDYRHDTPLQCSIGAVAGAQAVIFGMFGMAVTPDGDIVVNPQPPAWSPEIRLSGLTIRGCTMDIRANRRSYDVVANGQVIRSRTGAAVMLQAGRSAR